VSTATIIPAPASTAAIRLQLTRELKKICRTLRPSSQVRRSQQLNSRVIQMV
jgi:hypothetical protein